MSTYWAPRGQEIWSLGGRYCLEMASLHRLISNFLTVHLRLKSVREMVDFGPRNFWRPHCTACPRIHVENGAIWGPNSPNSQLSGKYPRGGPPCCQTRWRPGGIYCLEGRPSVN